MWVNNQFMPNRPPTLPQYLAIWSPIAPHVTTHCCLHCCPVRERLVGLLAPHLLPTACHVGVSIGRVLPHTFGPIWPPLLYSR